MNTERKQKLKFLKAAISGDAIGVRKIKNQIKREHIFFVCLSVGMGRYKINHNGIESIVTKEEAEEIGKEYEKCIFIMPASEMEK